MVMLHIHGESSLQWLRFGVISKMVGWHSLVFPRRKGTPYIITLTGRALQRKVSFGDKDIINVTSYKHKNEVHTLNFSDIMGL